MHLHRTVLTLTILLSHLTVALVTLQTIRNLTELTDECRGKIVAGDSGEGIPVVLMGEQQQAPMMFRSAHGDEDGEEIENTAAAALHLLCSELLVELEKPLDCKESQSTSLQCRVTIRQYHAFLGATVKFLHEIQERQLHWHWSAESGVFDGVSWLQGLWASRSTNKQDRSFIEQQMEMYAATDCFGKSQEVLRRDVEIVEYMNDLIDSFW